MKQTSTWSPARREEDEPVAINIRAQLECSTRSNNDDGD